MIAVGPAQKHGNSSAAAIHRGVDIPQLEGTPIRAVAEGVVVQKFANEGNRKGIEIMLRHTPAQTGLPFWTYSQYTHLLEMSPLPIGAKVALGQEIGKTSNSGKMGQRIRRDALHFAILYSERPGWAGSSPPRTVAGWTPIRFTATRRHGNRKRSANCPLTGRA